jgi:hypothetical protein
MTNANKSPRQYDDIFEGRLAFYRLDIIKMYQRTHNIWRGRTNKSLYQTADFENNNSVGIRDHRYIRFVTS